MSTDPTPTTPMPPRMPGAGGRSYQDAREYCDLVMQGGITSGVVYPMAALELATRYRFRGIGGSSAGAIAAAAVAAAEHGREARGFDTLEELCRDLGTENRLLSLFQPEKATNPLFDLLRGYLDWKRAGGALGGWIAGLFTGILWSAARTALIITILAVLALFGARYLDEAYYPSWWVYLPWWLAFVLTFLFLVAVFVAVLAWKAWRLWAQLQRLLAALQGNHWGVCTGLGSKDRGVALTDYLADFLDRLAALPPEQTPLTFGQLRAKRPDQPIDLLIMTSDLSLRRPVRFPLEGEWLLFNEAEWARLFPPAVVSALKKAQPKDPPAPPPAGYWYLPQGDALPVIVAVRISLSFPLLFSAVPLYTLSDSALQRHKTDPTAVPRPEELKRSYFSDGGIVSNFPIHLFDRWLPDCPTFGIDLAELPGEAFEGQPSQRESKIRGDYLSIVQTADHQRPAAGQEQVHLPDAHEEVALEWYAIDHLLDLLEGIFYTAKNHRDTLQSMLPSYRERIITIRLAEDEGGLNLSMPRDQIESIMQRGQMAGKVLRDEFNFPFHRWVRFQVILAQLELELRRMVAALDASDWWKSIDRSVTTEYPFPRDEKWCQQATAMVTQLLSLLEKMHGEERPFFDDGHGPTPSPVKRLVPPE
jgi:predicted acylesterase/phospholipase RssA